MQISGKVKTQKSKFQISACMCRSSLFGERKAVTGLSFSDSDKGWHRLPIKIHPQDFFIFTFYFSIFNYLCRPKF
jgi:hypothetical protein